MTLIGVPRQWLASESNYCESSLLFCFCLFVLTVSFPKETILLMLHIFLSETLTKEPSVQSEKKL